MENTTELKTKIKEVLNLLKDLNTGDADWILKQSLYNIKKASTLNNVEEFELEISGIK